jgi:hypothetical protein
MGWFGFLNPSFLWGALAASIPVIIHLINRRKARVVRFPAVQFVLRAERRVARKYRVKQWLLLALRTIILFLLTTALAEPVLQPNQGDLAEIAQTRAVALILDNTMSMAYQTAGTTAWELAKEAAGLVLQELRPQDRGVVLPLVSTEEPPQALSGERARLLDQVAALAITYESAGFVEPFQRAYALLRTSDAPKKEIVVVTDRTRTPWVGFEPGALKVIDPQVQVTVMVVGEKAPLANATVRDVRLEHAPAIVGVHTKVIARVANFGAQDRKQALVRLRIDERTVDQRLLDLPRGTTAEVVFDAVFDQPGYRSGTIALAGDALPADDTFYFSVPVRQPLRVLVIDGDPRTTLVASETFYIMNALHPERTARAGPIQPRVMPVEEAERQRLDDVDAVLLANVPSVSSSFRARLMEFVERGGGVWWFLGQLVDPNVYNRDFFDTTTRLLPARLGPRLDRTDAAPVTIQLSGAEHPLFKPFSGQGREALSAVRVRRLLTTDSASLPPTTRILMALPDGRPLLLEGQVGRGRALLFTSTADVDWNELPVTTAYLPLLQTGVIYLAGREAGQRPASDVRIPQPIALTVAASQRELPIVVSDPRGKETRLFPQEEHGQMQARYTEARVPGFYRLRLGQEAGLVAVNPPLEESDVTTMAPEEIAEKFPWTRVAVVPWERGQPVRPPQVEPLSLAGWFLIGLLALMLVEGVCANRLR